MASISFQEIYSRFFTKVEAYDLFDEGLSDEARNELLCNYVHSAIGKSYVNRLFSSIAIDDPLTVGDDSLDGVIEYELKTSTNEIADKEFVLEVLAYGVALSWIEPKVNSLTSIAQFFGTSDERFYAQANHLSELRSLRDDLVSAQRGLIRDRGYVNNDYLSGNFLRRD